MKCIKSIKRSLFWIITFPMMTKVRYFILGAGIKGPFLAFNILNLALIRFAFWILFYAFDEQVILFGYSVFFNGSFLLFDRLFYLNFPLSIFFSLILISKNQSFSSWRISQNSWFPFSAIFSSFLYFAYCRKSPNFLWGLYKRGTSYQIYAVMVLITVGSGSG